MRYNIMNGEKVAGSLEMFEGVEVYSLADYSSDCVRTESLLDELKVDREILDVLVKQCSDVDVLKKQLFYKKEDRSGMDSVTLDGANSRLLHGALGCITEGGELIEGLLGEPDDVNIMEEVGDLMWYVGILLDEVSSRGYPIIDVLKTNIAKLRKRYPEKFTEDAALNRDLDEERKVLEGKGIKIEKYYKHKVTGRGCRSPDHPGKDCVEVAE